MYHYRHRGVCHPVPRKIERGIELVELLTGGRGWVRRDGEWVTVESGALLWHQEGDETIGRADFDSPYRCLAVVFSVDPNLSVTLPRLSRWGGSAEVGEFTRDAVRNFLDEGFDRGALLAYLYGTLIYHVFLYHTRSPSPETPAALVAVLKLIDENYERPLQVEDLADRAGCSVPHLHAMFRKHIGTTPHQAVINRRIKAVRELLATNTEPLKQIADRCGFANAAALCRAFRRATGTSPAVFRRQRMQPWEAG